MNRNERFRLPAGRLWHTIVRLESPSRDPARFTPSRTLRQVANGAGPEVTGRGMDLRMPDPTRFAHGQPAVSPGAPAREDLSDQISRSVEKQPGDSVRCTLVCNANYRCNWWAPQATGGYDNPAMAGLLVTTHRVRKSRFLRVTRDGDRLVIEEISTR
jgi:hypothetical protein